MILSAVAGAVTVMQAPASTWPGILSLPVEAVTLARIQLFLGVTGVIFLAAAALVTLRPQFHGGLGAAVLVLAGISFSFAGASWIGPLIGIPGGLFTFFWDVPVTANVTGSLTCPNCGRTVSGSPAECPFCGYPMHPGAQLAWRFSYRRGGQA